MKGCGRFRHELLEYVDGHSDAIREHLAVCEQCAQAVMEMQQIVSLLAALPPEMAPEGFSQSVRDRIRTERRPGTTRVTAPRLAMAAAALALLVTVVLVRPWRPDASAPDLTPAEAALGSMTALHSQVQLAYILPADSPLGTKAEVPTQRSEYDELYDLEGM